MQVFEPDMHEMWNTGKIAVCIDWFFLKKVGLSFVAGFNIQLFICAFWIYLRNEARWIYRYIKSGTGEIKKICFERLMPVSIKLLKATEILVLYWRTQRTGLFNSCSCI